MKIIKEQKLEESAFYNKIADSIEKTIIENKDPIKVKTEVVAKYFFQAISEGFEEGIKKSNNNIRYEVGAMCEYLSYHLEILSKKLIKESEKY